MTKVWRVKTRRGGWYSVRQASKNPLEPKATNLSEVSCAGAETRVLRFKPVINCFKKMKTNKPKRNNIKLI